MLIQIKKINAVATHAVRHAILRKGKPRSTCFFEGDALPQTIHLGAFADERLLGVLSIYESSHNEFSEKVQNQLRGMAVLENFQGKGIGKILLEAAEKEISKRGPVRIWFNARVNAVPFYQHSNYQCVGERFFISEVGEHYLMTKCKE